MTNVPEVMYFSVFRQQVVVNRMSVIFISVEQVIEVNEIFAT